MQKTALITGASSGIGLELAKIFAAKRIHLVLVARSSDKLQHTAHDLARKNGIEVHTIVKDLSKADAAREVFEWCEAHKVQIDYLINNAGFGDFGMFAESNWDKQIDMINLNITSLTYLTWLCLPGMKSRGYGRIMNVASTASFQPGPTMSVYYATKAYVLHFSEAIANELEGTGVTVTALCPGPTESNFQDAADLSESKLVKGKKLPSALSVAQYGYKAMMKGKAVAIHGMGNYLLANSVRFAPRSIAVKLVRKLQDK